MNATQAGNKLSKPTTFILPELATDPVNKSGISNRLPPSCESGSLYLDPWGRSYAQPLIEYYLQATLQYRVDNETAVRTISAKRRIRITTAPHSDPPEYSKEVAEKEPVTASADIRRSRFSKSFARLSVAMGEPSTVVARNTSGCCQTTGQLHVGWETSSDADDEFEIAARPSQRMLPQALTWNDFTRHYPAAQQILRLWFQHSATPSTVRIMGWKDEQAAAQHVRDMMR